jgi:hypothetical protein
MKTAPHMKIFKTPYFWILIMVFSFSFSYPSTSLSYAPLPRAGFHLPDSVNEMTIKFRSIKNLIILPVTLNDSIEVNLILDTGCRNLVLFGKRFQKLLNAHSDKVVQFSGLGSGAPVKGYLSLNNEVSIEAVLGEKVPVVVVPNKNLFSMYNDVHGVIGYEIFQKFEIEINPKKQLITFRSATRTTEREGYSKVLLQVVDSRPVMNSTITMDSNADHTCDLMIDTGSSLGLLLKTTDLEKFKYNDTEKVIGRGLNGLLMGIETIAKKLQIQNFEMTSLPTGIVESQWHNHASIGMDILKDYILVLNYCKSYACFKKIS